MPVGAPANAGKSTDTSSLKKAEDGRIVIEPIEGDFEKILRPTE
jgi:hypothetical protein